jgi:hypothetical protein
VYIKNEEEIFAIAIIVPQYRKRKEVFRMSIETPFVSFMPYSQVTNLILDGG